MPDYAPGMRFLIAAVFVFLAACSNADPTPPAAAPTPTTPRTVTGVVVDIESRALNEVDSFTLKDGDETYEIFIDPAREYGFPLSHLNAHQTGGEPVAVDVEERDGRLVALTISDV